MVRFPFPGDGRVSLDQDPGVQLCADACLLPQRHGLWRQQRLHRLQGHSRFRSRRGCDEGRAARGDHRGAGRELSRLSGDRSVARGARDSRDPRRGEPRPVSRLPRRLLQALGVRVLRCDRRPRGRALRAPGRHHQSERIRADQLDRGGYLGGGWRPGHSGGSRARGRARELRQDVLYRRAPRRVALRPGRALRAGDALPPAWTPGTRVARSPHAAGGPGPSQRLAASRSCRRVGRKQSEMKPPRPESSRGRTLRLVDVTVSFDGFKALDGLSLTVSPGELRCIIGSNGAGKTTMMDVVSGKTRPDRGSAWFGEDVNLLALSEPEIVQAGIGRKFQKPTVFERLTVFENLELALWGDKSFRKLLFARLTRSERLHIDDVLDAIGLTERRAGLAGALSHGEKQWLEKIGRAHV